MARKNRKKAAQLRMEQKARRRAKLERLKAVRFRNYGYTPYEPPEPPATRLPVYLNDIFPKHTPVELLFLEARGVKPQEGRINWRHFSI
jgi:hypothetical protein